MISLYQAIGGKDGNTVNCGDALDICNASYKVTLSSTAGSLTTEYGVPNNSIFSGNTETYYISTDLAPKICYVRLNLEKGKDYMSSMGANYAGLADIWNPDKVFLV
ncbi:hypothetical protein [Gilliamella sp. Pas-s27]|uniref:hypothetical protein n=1 Tax=Gilliamella sp. Pas-s27 TaxID=2687311 RepID=UPI001365A3B6|nr:hypothetical protein [Gilliamella sp. Pas-s27]MWP45828.1 hypothetical protein [Gilliamella sp. Pas-s27]